MFRNGLYTNYLGSPIKAADSAGHVTWSEQYYSYGEKRWGSGQQADEMGFTGHIEDAATGLVRR